MNLLSMTLGRIVPRYRTLNEWLEIYLAGLLERQITRKTLINREAHIRRIVTALGNRRIGSIRPYEIGSFIAQLGKVYPVAAKRTLVEIRTMFDEAMANGWVESNPARAVKLPRVTVRRRRLSMSEWRLIFEHAREQSPPWVHRMILLALVTGQRRSDLAKMRFSDVWMHDDGFEYIHVTQAKTGARLAIPTELRMLAIGVSIGEAIQNCRCYAKDGDGHLLRKSTGYPPCLESMSWRFEQARELCIPPEIAGVRPPSLHECRSLAAREYRTQGVDTQALLGHSRQAMTDLYHNDRGLDAREGKWRVVALSGRLS